jgi:hypothetical protein
MPNWVEHELKITGPEAELNRFLAECLSEGKRGQRRFDTLIPMPAEIRDSTDGGGKNLDGSIRFADWYMWCCANWGTKWNACHTEVALVGNGSKAVRLRFDTAWSIPWPIYEALAERFPLLTIDGEIVELMMEFGGHICCHSGNIDYQDKSEQIKAQMAEFYAKFEREPATIRNNSTTIDDDVPF